MKNQPTISLIVAMDLNRVIGVNGKLPWRVGEDLQFFKRMTFGKPVIMGRKTFESLDRPLKDRLNIVLTKNSDFKADGCVVVHSVDEALHAAGECKEIMVIGGAQIYQAFLPLADKIYITEIQSTFSGDTYFPDVDKNVWRQTLLFIREKSPTNPFAFNVSVWTRRK